MSFATPAFLVFLLVVYTAYWRLGMRGQNWLIFVASIFFYGWWDWRFVSVLFATATIDYWVALRLMRVERESARKPWLSLSIISNLGMLGFFKYWNFFIGSFAEGIKTLGMEANLPMLEVILPLGISFYTFQALSYTVDVYRRELPAVHNYVQYMCFITFFPHMVAGPIQQARHFLVQFNRERHFDWSESVDGCRQMLWGFFKKMVIADSLAQQVELAYGNPEAASGIMLLWATYMFAVQIYCDFSGYTDIAIGCAKLFNFHLTRNFAYPYFSTSIPEFWKRWHIALSDWFRRYLYIPLGGNRGSRTRWALNIMIVFLVSGLWHGANWTFLVWGLLHGLFYLASTLLWPEKAPGLKFQPMPLFQRITRMVITFHLVCLTWVFFRAESMADALQVLGRIGSGAGGWVLQGMNLDDGLLLVGILFAVEWLGRNNAHALAGLPLPKPIRWGVYYAIVVAILLGMPLAHVPFIYFQF